MAVYITLKMHSDEKTTNFLFDLSICDITLYNGRPKTKYGINDILFATVLSGNLFDNIFDIGKNIRLMAGVIASNAIELLFDALFIK
jgi:hypothetical protein